MNLRETYAVLRDTGALGSMGELDRWMGQRPGYSRRGGPRRAGLPALMRLARRLDSLHATKAVAPLRDLRSALDREISKRVAGDAVA